MSNRDKLMDAVVEQICKPSPFVAWVLANRPPDNRTPFQKARDRCKRKWEDFRIALSKKIYDWSSYEDE